MRKKILCLILIIGCLLSPLNVSFITYAKELPEEPEQLYARSAVLMDADSGRVLFGKEESVARPMASTTKIMTCIVALEQMQEEQVISISQNAASQPKVRLGLKEKESYRMLDLLYSLMLESHNDSAVAIAEGISGSMEAFAALMNEKAKAIGCEDTYFITPNGLDAKDETGVHSTTAVDLVRIMRYCIMESPKKEAFLEITRTAQYTFANTEGRSFSCSNHNAFLTMMDGALSGKTGFTGDAGYCYVGALQRDGRTFIVALLACGWPNNKSYKWADTKKLMAYGLDNYTYRPVWREPELGAVKVGNGVWEHAFFNREVYVPVVVKDPEPDLSVLLRKDESIDVSWKVKKEVEAPVKREEQLGTVTYQLNGKTIKTFDIIADKAVAEKNLERCAQVVARQFCLLWGNK